MKNHTRAQSMLRLSRLSPLIILAAALVALAVFFAPGGQPAQAQTAEVEYWSSNLTVGNLPPNAWRGYSSALSRGQLSDNDFVYEGVTYVVTNLTDRGNGAVLLELDKAIPSSLKEALTLTFRGRQLALKDAVAPNAQSVRWNNTRVRFSLDDVVNVKLIKPAVPAPPPPPPVSPDLTDTRTVWSATLTVGDASGGEFGYDSAAGVGTLPNSTITYDGMDYDILGVFNDGTGALTFWFAVETPPNSLKSPPSAPALTLNVGNSLSDIRQFALSDATLTNSDTRLVWNSAGLSWAEDDTVGLWLTVKISEIDPPLPTLTASFSPDGPVKEDWETNSAHDLWSATLTVQDLSTPESAPANRGCDDGDANASCRSALTDRDFRFNGETYTVIGISYNQRKVAADVDTFQVKTYPESLRLTLDKAIPESLQSCLTLHSGNAKVPFADDGLPGAGVDSTLSGSTLTVTAIGAVNAGDLGWGLNWSTGGTVALRLPNVGCLTLTLSEPVDAETSLQWRRGGTADSSDYQRIWLPTFAAGSTTAHTPVRPVDDGDAEGCETIILDMTMWPGTYWAVHERFTVAIQDDDMPSRPCVGGA